MDIFFSFFLFFFFLGGGGGGHCEIGLWLGVISMHLECFLKGKVGLQNGGYFLGLL